MKILAVDTEPGWLKFCAECGFDTSGHIKGGYDVILLGSRMLSILATYQGKAQVIIASSSPSEGEAIEAYRHGAVNYVTKSWNRDKFLGAIGF